MKITEIDEQILKEIKNYMIEHGVVPTQKELAKKMYFTAPTMQYHYTKLIELGYMKKVGKHRFIVKGMKYVEE